MKQWLYGLLLVLIAGNAFAAHTSFPFLRSTIIVTGKQEGARLLGTADGYASNFSLFDIQSKTGDIHDTVRMDYYLHAAKQPLDWTEEESDKIWASFNLIADSLQKMGISLTGLPEKIYLIKSTMLEEYGADGYTRGNSIIIKMGQSINASILSHELFHVFSRYNTKKRDELYRVFNFKKCNPIALNQALDNLNITNPDCPVVQHYVAMPGKDVTLVLYSSKPYTGGDVFSTYVNVGVMTLEGDDTHKKVKLVNGKPEIKELQGMPEIFQYIGANTFYALHPEEICAEHFSMLMTGKQVHQPELLQKFYDTLKK